MSSNPAQRYPPASTGRRETPAERLDRNWEALLQELRVTQTGVQLLTGFLLMLPFQERFSELPTVMKAVYLGTVGASVIATALLIAPVAAHRLLFRRHKVSQLVEAAHRLALTGLSCLAIALTGVSMLVFYAVAGAAAGIGAGLVILGLCLWAWLVLPLRERRRPVPDGAVVGDSATRCRH